MATVSSVKFVGFNWWQQPWGDVMSPCGLHVLHWL